MSEHKYKDAVVLLMQTNRLHRKLAEKRAAKMDLQPSQHRMLMYLAKNDVTPSQCEIAKKFDISPAAVATTLKKLEKMGYIEKARPSDDRDGRVNEIKATEKGQKEALNTCEYFSCIDKAMFRGFSDEEIATLSSLLERASANLLAAEEKMEEI